METATNRMTEKIKHNIKYCTFRVHTVLSDRRQISMGFLGFCMSCKQSIKSFQGCSYSKQICKTEIVSYCRAKGNMLTAHSKRLRVPLLCDTAPSLCRYHLTFFTSPCSWKRGLGNRHKKMSTLWLILLL